MDMISRLAMRGEWENFLRVKTEQGNMSEREEADLRSYIEREEYLRVIEKISSAECFAPPEKTLISKSKAGRKRAVYTYGREENYVLKLTAFLLRDYDGLFAPNLYSFRKDRGVKRAVRDILSLSDLDLRYVYRADISDYFNSVDTEILLPELRQVLEGDPALYGYIAGLLADNRAVFDGEVIEERKGIMAGVPVSAFLANLYLRELDFRFLESGIPYVRYSDDILVFAKDRQELEGSIAQIKEYLSNRGLTINEEKESISAPGEPWDFLGFRYHLGTVDISLVSFEKLKAKMRRKTRALARWAAQKNVDGTRAAKAFVRRFNAKLYDNPVYSELTWTRWFFPVINTSATLRQIDAYMQDCIRRLATGKKTKSKYNFRYDDIKKLGYRSLVAEYYRQKKLEDEQ